MSDLVKTLLDNEGRNRLIIDIQRERPLRLKGISPIKIYSQGSNIKNVLFDASFHDESGHVYKAYKLQLETINELPLCTTIYDDSVFYQGGFETFAIDTAKIDYARLNSRGLLPAKNIREKIDLSEKGYEAFAICETDRCRILLPSMAIGAFFYFPNTYVRRAFLKQNIGAIMQTELSSCRYHGVCLKSGVKFDETTVLLAYLYHCNNFSRKYFYNAFSYYIKSKIKDTKHVESKEEEGFRISYAKFKFPVNGVFNASFRGEYLDEKHFLAYEIVGMEFGDMLSTGIVNGFYEGKKKKSFGTKFFNKGRGHSESLSHTAPYSTGLTQENIDVTKFGTIASDVIVEKRPAIDAGRENGSLPSQSSNEHCKGATLGNERDDSSCYAKGTLKTLRFDFKKAVEHLKNRLKPWDNNSEFIEKAEYFAFIFSYKKRHCLLVELKEYESSTLLFSSMNELDEDYIVRKILAIKSGENKTHGSYSAFGRNLKSEKSVCFHPAQKHVGENLSAWAERIIEKLNRPEKCRG